MDDHAHTAAIETANRRLLRFALIFGLAGSLMTLAATAQQDATPATLLLALAWSLAWALLAAKPAIAAWMLRRWHWTTLLVVGASVGTTVTTGGFDSPLKTEANWWPWAAPVLLGARPSLAVAASVSGGLLVSFLLGGMSPHDIVAGPDRFTAVTEIIHPLTVALVGLALTGVFRSQLIGAPDRLARARTSNSGLGRLLSGSPVLALPPAENSEDAAGARPLTPAEETVVDGLAAGLTPQQIARERRVASGTVYDQITSAKRKCGAHTIEHLIVLTWRIPTS